MIRHKELPSLSLPALRKTERDKRERKKSKKHICAFLFSAEPARRQPGLGAASTSTASRPALLRISGACAVLPIGSRHKVKAGGQKEGSVAEVAMAHWPQYQGDRQKYSSPSHEQQNNISIFFYQLSIFYQLDFFPPEDTRKRNFSFLSWKSFLGQSRMMSLKKNKHAVFFRSV
jgi:hypothetical protein